MNAIIVERADKDNGRRERNHFDIQIFKVTNKSRFHLARIRKTKRSDEIIVKAGN